MKIGMLFPGYPSQFVGMGKELYDNSRTVQEYFEEASNCLGMNFVKLCFASSDAEITKVGHAFPALFLNGISTAQMIQDAFPDLLISGVAGYGVGEYSALYTAHSLSLPDGLYLLNKFSQFYGERQDELNERTVIITGVSDRKLKQLCEEHAVQITVTETQRHLVSGAPEDIDLFIDSARQAGAGRVKTADVIAGYHMPSLQDVVDQLTIYLTKVDVHDPEITVYSGVDGKQIKKAKKAQEVLMSQAVKPLVWKNVLKQFADYDMLLVPGPSKVLVKELSVLYPEKIILGVETMADLELLQAILHGGAAEPVLQMV